METIANDSVMSMLTDSNCNSWDEDLIMWITGEPLCCKLETNMIVCQLYFNNKKECCFEHLPAYGFSLLTLDSHVWDCW